MNIPHPREHDFLVGHDTPLSSLRQAMESGRMHHAWLLTGDEGIGKATLAYRMIRTLLAGSGMAAPKMEVDSFSLFGEPEPAAEAPVSTGLDFNVSVEHPVSRRISNQSHGDLLVLEAGENEKTGKKGDINVDMVRQVGAFMSLTPSESAWRIVLIDGADSMNPNAANALLKVLEEPPAHGLIFLVSHSSGKLLPTIRSRCRKLAFHSLSEAECAQAVEHFLPKTSHAEIAAAMTLAGTSVGQTLALLHDQGMEKYKATLALLQGAANPKQMIALAEQMAKADAAGWAWFARGINRLLLLISTQASHSSDAHAMLPEEKTVIMHLAARRPLDSWLSLWDKTNQMMRQTHQLNLDKRETAFEVLNAMTLKETA